MRHFIYLGFIYLSVILLSACNSHPANIALGTLERDRISLTATANEVVVALPVAPGSSVKKGMLLVKLDDTLQLAQVNKAKANVMQAQAHLEKLRHGARPEVIAAASARVAGARAAVIKNEDHYLRSIDMIKQKLISQSTLDKALASRDASIASLKSAQEKLLELTNGTREEDLRAADATLAGAIASLASENTRLANLSVIATRDGILDNLPWNLGERVTIGSPLAIVLAGRTPFARIYVPEPYRIKLKTGDRLIVHVDGIEKPITGKLRWIATAPAFTPYYALNQTERSHLMYLAEVQLPDSAAQLPSGVPAQVELP